MIKKVLIIIGSVLLLAYGAYLQTIVIMRGNEFNAINAKKIEANNKYQTTKKIIINNNEQVSGNVATKANLEASISEKTGELNKLNDEINAKKVAINKKNEAQAKQNILNNNGGKVAFLTFDDGPSGYTSKVLDVLKEYNVKATFFVNGRSADYYDIYRRIVNEGHSIGNHTYSHAYGTVYASVDAFDNDFNRLQTLIKDVTGVTMDIMRFPGGSNNTVSNNYTKDIMNNLTARYKSLGYTYFDWNVSAGDSASSGVTDSYVINNIVNGCRNTKYAIILIHDSHKTTSDTIEQIIIDLANMGFKFLPLTSASYAIQFK